MIPFARSRKPFYGWLQCCLLAALIVRPAYTSKSFVTLLRNSFRPAEPEERTNPVQGETCHSENHFVLNYTIYCLRTPRDDDNVFLKEIIIIEFCQFKTVLHVYCIAIFKLQ